LLSCATRLQINTTIDPGPIGPTEVRILIVFSGGHRMVFWKHPDLFFYNRQRIVFFLINVVDTFKLLKLGNERDAEEKLKKQAAQ
jgi:hypothetical protein